jgi:hypothetical protein
MPIFPKTFLAAVLAATALAACTRADATDARTAASTVAAHFAADAPRSPASAGRSSAVDVAPGPYAPNRMGEIPVFEYHVIAKGPTEFHHTPEELRRDLQLLYDRGYRPVTITEINQRRIDQVIPRGYKAFAAVFDDANPSQFRYLQRADGSLVIDPTSAVGIWTRFTATHPGWRNAATFCVLSGGDGGGAFFGNGNIQGQKTAWRFPKMRFLAANGFEICNHTLWHARLDRYSDAFDQEQIAKLALAVDSAVPGYRIHTFALPLGVWPRNRSIAWQGSWRDPKTGRMVAYHYDTVLEVSGGPNPSPYDPQYDPHSIKRIIGYKNAVQIIADRLDRHHTAYVSAGTSRTR